MEPTTRPWTLTIPSDPRLLPLVRRFVEAVCEAGGVDDGVTHAVVLAIHEAAHNIIRHAHRGDVSAPFQLDCFLWPDRVEVLLLDEGEPFDIDAVPNLDPAELRIGGRGVFLMRRLMDEVSCRPRGQRGNALRMVKRRVCNSSRRDAV